MSYSEKLQDPRWQKKRLDILNRDNWTCQLCQDTKETFHVHHLSYVWGKDPWDYPDKNFISYCKVCHKVVEELKSVEKDLKILAIIKSESPEGKNRVKVKVLITLLDSDYKGISIMDYHKEGGSLDILITIGYHDVVEMSELINRKF